jgi:hypothetical protein
VRTEIQAITLSKPLGNCIPDPSPEAEELFLFKPPY